MTLTDQILDLRSSSEYQKVIDLVKELPATLGPHKPFSRFEENVPDPKNKQALELKRKFERDRYKLRAYKLLH